MTFMAINNKHLIASSRTSICYWNKKLCKPLYTDFVCCPTIIAYIKSSVIRESIKPALLMISLCFKDNI
jgi:hypothetical protein